MSIVAQEEDLARVTIISSTRRVDLALPGTVTLSELLPSILKFSGIESNTPTEAVHAWILQRFGEDPFDLYSPISKLGIRDGETLYLRQRENAIPDVAYDDVVDAVAGATNSRPSWKHETSRIVSLICLVLILVGIPILILLMNMDTTRLVQGALLGAIALISFAAFVAAVSISRAAKEVPTATVLAWISVTLASVVGWWLPVVIAKDPAFHIHILLASSILLVASAANALAAQVHTMALFATAVFAAIMLGASSVMALNYDNDANIAAATMSLMTLSTILMPWLSYRIAGIALPNLPVTTEAMLADETPVQSDIVTRALFADRLLGGLFGGICLATTANAAITMTKNSWWVIALVLCIGLAFMLRARAFVGFTQRLALLLSGATITSFALTAIAISLATSLPGILVLLVLTIFFGYVFAHYSASWFKKILSPTWGRCGDILEWLSVIGIVPFLLGSMEFYTWFRGLFNF